MNDPKPGAREATVFGGGCFWCTEAVFRSLRGVISVVPGYAGGTGSDPDYDQVATGMTGHAECIKIEFDPAVISFEDLLAVFFNTHDPTTLNRQGADIGTQYRSAIFYTDDEQRVMALRAIDELTKSHAYDKPIVTEVKPLEAFYPAEAYHVDYFRTHKDEPYCELVIAPKMEKFQKRFAELITDSNTQ